jgi:signal transduction histidine kinase
MSQAATKLSSADLSVRLPLPLAKDELRHLAETFNEMLHRLEDGFLRLRRFTGDVSHELRTPLAVLSGEAEFALRKVRSADDYRRSLETILTESRHMTGIVENLLLLARAESRAVAMTWMPLDLHDFLRDLVQGVAPMYEKESVQLNVVISDAPETFDANPGYLTLALRNILLNAAKHSTANSTVTLTVTRDGAFTVFAIKDQGEGIPAESLPYVFDPFYRADTARNRAAGGAGIGLSLAMALVKLHGGSIAVSSRPQEGATFTVKIAPQAAGAST